MSTLTWRIRKKEAELQELQSKYATAVQLFGHPETPVLTRTNQIQREMFELRKTIKEQMATLRSMLILSGGHSVRELR